ncbi:CLUMA_CG003725, isoform A [Clunio marinus]|uniref:CLUMA_CG003725, isoform A n=1 Tax=Clunio marinus TaxID=568069 RepID=A0A1J1HPM2_9DIPT|nr:CLUMA_CG003725, isoform A [Clunio marinus]
MLKCDEGVKSKYSINLTLKFHKMIIADLKSFQMSTEQKSYLKMTNSVHNKLIDRVLVPTNADSSLRHSFMEITLLLSKFVQ